MEDGDEEIKDHRSRVQILISEKQRVKTLTTGNSS